MAGDPEGVVSFDAAGTKYTAVFGFRAMKAVEAHYELPFFAAIGEAMPALDPADVEKPEKVMAAMLALRVTELGRLFGFALLKHHPDLTEDEVAELIDTVGLKRAGEIMGRALNAALQPEGGGGAAANPSKRGGRKGRTG